MTEAGTERGSGPPSEDVQGRPGLYIVDDDPVSRLVYERTLLDAGYDVSSFGTGEALLARLADDRPERLLVVLDWELPGISGVQVCQRVRELEIPAFILLVTGNRTSHANMTNALEAGVDDFVTKPMPPADLLARVQVGAKLLARPVSPTQTVRQALTQALATPGGELVVRGGDVVGRIHVYGGKVAWAHTSTEPGSLDRIFGSLPELGKEEARAVVGECRKSGKNIGDVLVEWGLMEEAEVRTHIVGWIRRKIEELLDLSDPQTLFIPSSRPAGSSSYSFDLGEVCPDEAPAVDAAPLRAATTAPHGGLGGRETLWFTAALEQGGSPVLLAAQLTELLRPVAASYPGSCVAVMDHATGGLMARAGGALDLDIAWAMLRLLGCLPDDEQIEIEWIISKKHLFVALPLSAGHIVLGRFARDKCDTKEVQSSLQEVGAKLERILEKLPW